MFISHMVVSGYGTYIYIYIQDLYAIKPNNFLFINIDVTFLYSFVSFDLFLEMYKYILTH